ncbi:spindle and kinetochore-associated protein 1 [Caerostris darwini]|uniref:SKA complex subunit 1 n=1 Tax=Caerostris darwini TaxID=1538125 RepID=A0AAV4R369_9ARAC|nr:spindle and kinetochore-associated protein 1 [Caerostris darwini]
MSSIVENCLTVAELDKEFSKKISLVRDALQLKNMDVNVANEFQSLRNDIKNIKEQFKELRSLIKCGEQNTIELQKLLKKVEGINKTVDHMEENFPAVLKSNVPAPQKETNEISKEAPPGNLPVAANSNSKSIKKLQLVAIPEFENVPKYMKGRIKYEEINAFVEKFNAALEEKYKLLSMPRKGMKPPQLKTWQKIKAQENPESKGLFFCTVEDLKDFGRIKLDKASLNILTILRHCGKMKEIRGPGHLIRYTVM